MDDMTSRLSEILGDPASMEKLKNLAAMFGGSDRQAEAAPAASQQRPPPPSPPPPPQNRQSAPAAAPSLDPELMRSIMKLAPALSQMRQGDDTSTQLLHALRPFLGDARRKRLDEALRLLQLARMLPYLRNSGLLQSLF